MRQYLNKSYVVNLFGEKMPRIYQQGNVIKKTISAIISLLVGVALGDTVVTTVTGINTTAWTFTGYSAVVAVINLIPLMYYAGVVIMAGLAFMTVK